MGQVKVFMTDEQSNEQDLISAFCLAEYGDKKSAREELIFVTIHRSASGLNTQNAPQVLQLDSLDFHMIYMQLRWATYFTKRLSFC